VSAGLGVALPFWLDRPDEEAAAIFSYDGALSFGISGDYAGRSSRQAKPTTFK
jgi:hypothetical protein